MVKIILLLIIFSLLICKHQTLKSDIIKQSQFHGKDGHIVTMFANRNNKWSCKLIAIHYSYPAFPCWSNSQPLSLWLFLVYPLSFFSIAIKGEIAARLRPCNKCWYPWFWSISSSSSFLNGNLKIYWLLEHQYIIDWMSERKILMKVSLNIFIAYPMVWLYYNLILSFICFLLFLYE